MLVFCVVSHCVGALLVDSSMFVFRVARTKAAPTNSLAGMNELEGSVLLEADDYRRLVNEVKALKTALLKLKRELQEEVSVLDRQWWTVMVLTIVGGGVTICVGFTYILQGVLVCL